MTDNIIKRIHEVQKKEKKSLEHKTLKLMEESGEVAQALLSYLKASGCEYKGHSIEDVGEELADVILVALSLYYQLDFNDEQLEKILNKKIKKWEQKITIN